MKPLFLVTALLLAAAGAARAGVGDPQMKTDHPWYPGELACSTFERLFKTQADLYERVTGKKVATDEDYDFVFNASQIYMTPAGIQFSPIMYAKKKLDLTDRVFEELAKLK